MKVSPGAVANAFVNSSVYRSLAVRAGIGSGSEASEGAAPAAASALLSCSAALANTAPAPAGPAAACGFADAELVVGGAPDRAAAMATVPGAPAVGAGAELEGASS